IEEARKQVEKLGSDIQSLSHRLHSSNLEYLGLVAASSGFCRELSLRRMLKSFSSPKISRTSYLKRLLFVSSASCRKRSRMLLSTAVYRNSKFRSRARRRRCNSVWMIQESACTASPGVAKFFHSLVERVR